MDEIAENAESLDDVDFWGSFGVSLDQVNEQTVVFSRTRAQDSMPAWKLLMLEPNPDPKAYLFNSPFAVQENVNTSNFPALRTLMSRLCVPGCALGTRIVPNINEGTSQFPNIFESLVRTRPDYTMAITNIRMNSARQVLEFYASCRGSQIFNDPLEVLYNTIDHGRRGTVDERLRRRAMNIRATGSKIVIDEESKVTWTLTPDCASIRRISLSTNVVAVGELV